MHQKSRENVGSKRYNLRSPVRNVGTSDVCKAQKFGRICATDRSPALPQGVDAVDENRKGTCFSRCSVHMT